TRLVHVWSAPVGYLTRPYLVYRRRATPAPTAAGGRRRSASTGRAA
ncbi:respiratory nitrate reductase subunit gamma, partial [Streptomyces sp. ID05-04B]